MNHKQDKRSRVVVLAGPGLRHRHTCATLIERGVNVAGICICDQRSGGLPLSYIARSFKRRSSRQVLSQIAGRVYYRLLNARADRRIERRLYDAGGVDDALQRWAGPIRRTASYANPETLEWLGERRPDLLIVHTGGWVGRKVRDLVGGRVIGGHPGITPHYRGAHSAFWAIYNGKPHDVGWSVFWLDSGVDTGDLIAQGRTEIELGDSYFTLAWKSMQHIADVQVQAVLAMDAGQPIPRMPHESIPDGSEYPVPGLGDYLRYRRRQRQVR